MRKSLFDSFDKIYILNLHGSTKRREVAFDGSKDENVFDIQQGVSINLFCRTEYQKQKECQVYHYDLYGSREDKYSYLNDHILSDINWEVLNPQSPQYFFVPKDFSVQDEYEKGFMIGDLMPLSSSGVKTHHDKELVSTTPFNSEYNQAYTYRPLDNQWIDYDLNKVVRHRYKYMQHLLKDNISLIIGPQGQAIGEMPWNIVYVSKHLVDTNIFYRGGGIVFPLYLYTENMGEEEHFVNFNRDLYEKIAMGLNYLPCYDDDLLIDPTPEYNGVLYPQDLFDYIYAVLHSPSYRERYKEFLKIDFPRIPYPTDWERFCDLAEKGEELRQLHLMVDLPNSTGISFPQAGTLQVDCYRWEQNRVYINSEQYFEGVPESAWNFYIGGYQPAQKWLKDRKGMTLSFEDVKHYQRIIYVLQQTERVMKEIDELLN
jgi:predicted helicase